MDGNVSLTCKALQEVISASYLYNPGCEGDIPVSKTWSSNPYLHTQSGYCTSLDVTLPGFLESSSHANWSAAGWAFYKLKKSVWTNYPSVSALSCCQLSHHPFLHPLAMGHDQFQYSQRIGAHSLPLQAPMSLCECVLVLCCFAVPLQGQKWIAEVILAITLLDESIFVLSLKNTDNWFLQFFIAHTDTVRVLAVGQSATSHTSGLL